MHRHPLLIAGMLAGVTGLGWVVFMVAGQADLGLGSIFVQAGLLGLAVFTLSLVVLWLIEAYSGPRA